MLVVEQFYDDAQRQCESIPQNDCIIILGDVNPWLGREEIYQDVISKHSLHKVSNDNCRRLIQLATLNNTNIMSTAFPHKKYSQGHLDYRWNHKMQSN